MKGAYAQLCQSPEWLRGFRFELRVRGAVESRWWKMIENFSSVKAATHILGCNVSFLHMTPAFYLNRVRGMLEFAINKHHLGHFRGQTKVTVTQTRQWADMMMIFGFWSWAPHRWAARDGTWGTFPAALLQIDGGPVRELAINIIPDQKAVAATRADIDETDREVDFGIDTRGLRASTRVLRASTLAQRIETHPSDLPPVIGPTTEV